MLRCFGAPDLQVRGQQPIRAEAYSRAAPSRQHKSHVTVPIRRLIVLATAVCLIAGVPREAAAQAFGIGPRLSWVRPHLPSNTEAARFIGGLIRLGFSKRMVVELALDQKTRESSDGTVRIRERPFQGSLLLYPVRATLSPYLLGGFGTYSRKADVLEGSSVISSISDRRTGWHVGIGGELRMGRHAGLFVDYRFRFVQFGDPDDESDPIDIPGLSTLRASHQGSMWTSGFALYF